MWAHCACLHQHHSACACEDAARYCWGSPDRAAPCQGHHVSTPPSHSDVSLSKQVQLHF